MEKWMVESFVLITVSVGVFLFTLFIFVMFYISRFKNVPLQTAMVRYTRRIGEKEKCDAIMTGGGAFIIPFVQRIEWLPLNVRFIEIDVPDAPAYQGDSKIPLHIKASSQIHIGKDPERLRNAERHLLHKSDEEINDIAMKILKKHISSTAAKSQFWEIHKDRDAFGEKVRISSEKELFDLGLEVRSLLIKDIF
jgi:uncharacterized membrane protein YqiK